MNAHGSKSGGKGHYPEPRSAQAAADPAQRYGCLWRCTWEGVGGSIEPGESPEEAILREVREEVGIEDIAIERLAYTSLCHGDEPMLIIAYLCSTQSQTVRLSDEHQAWRWVDKQTCRELLPDAIWQDFERHGVFEMTELK